MKTIKSDQPQSTVEEKSAPEVHRSGSKAGESKADARYWMQGNRLKFHDSADYAMQIQAERRRVWFNLGTPNRKKAAAKAAEIFAFLKAQGFAATAEKYKPKGDDPKKSGKTTVGDLIEEATKLSTARRHSLDAYTKALRCIVAEIKGITPGKNTDGKGSAHAAWRAQVDAVALELITPAEVTAWKNARLRAVESDPLAKRRTIVTVNSLVRNAKALFGKKILPFIEQSVTVPKPLPFDGVSFEKPPSMRYVSRVDAFGIVALARQELATAEPEAFKVLLLALVCGLRRSEIDNLLWRSFDFGRKVLRVESNEFHQLKSEDSAGEIDLDDDTVALFRGYRAQHPKAVFVIESPNKPRNETKSRCYRCDATFKRVLEWLRAQGVEAPKPLHTMRKEIGSIIASEHGIFEASRYLRHSDIRITSAIYADKKKAVTPKAFDGLLGGGAQAAEFSAGQEEANKEAASA